MTYLARMLGQHVKGINWQVVHELLEAELDRIDKGTSSYVAAGGSAEEVELKQWWKDEFTRMNEIAVANAERQS